MSDTLKIQLWKVVAGPFTPEDNPCDCEDCLENPSYWLTVMTTEGDSEPVDLDIFMDTFDEAYTLKKEIDMSMEPLVMEINL